MSDIVRATLNASPSSKLVAIKKIRSCNQENSKILIQHELTIWSILDIHNHIVPLLGITTGGSHVLQAYEVPFAVSNYYESESLEKFLRKNLTCQTRLDLLVGVTQGLEHIHKQSVVHGDLKAANIVVEVEGQRNIAKITDFGSSSLACECYTNPDELCGTIFWDSPELYEDEEGSRTTHSDVWAFGCVALEVQMGVYPYGRFGTNVCRLVWILAQPKPELPAIESDLDLEDKPISKSVWKVMQKCWELDPRARPSASMLVQSLRAIYDSPDVHELGAALAPLQL